MEPTTSLVTALASKAGGASLDVAKEEAKGFLKLLLGPSIDAYGQNFALGPRERMFNNIVEVLARAKKTMKAAGISPREVPLKIIHPLLEGAAVEEEPDLQEMWANLLANAADPETNSHISVSFISILKELSPNDARFLHELFERHQATALISLDSFQFMVAASNVKLSEDQWHLSLDVLKRNGVIEERVGQGNITIPEDNSVAEYFPQIYWRFTSIGIALIKACSSPKNPRRQPVTRP
jgi:hypothetical protein